VEKHYQLNRRDQIVQQFVQQAIQSVGGLWIYSK
jgi:hypothetical protein